MPIAISLRRFPRFLKRAAGSHAVTILAGAAWLLAIGVGMAVMIQHQWTPGVGAHPRNGQWPGGTLATLGGADYTVVMFAHPRCPCTRASLGELHQLATAAGGHAKCEVFFMLPTGADADWRHTDNWTLAAAIPEARLFNDYEGRQATAFGVETSGQVLIYDRTGALRYQGGITDGRGQEGENPGLDAAMRLVRSNVSPTRTFPVFGCSLHDEIDPPPASQRHTAGKPL